MIVVQHVLVQAPGVFGQAERGIRTLPLGQVDRIDRRDSRSPSPDSPDRCSPAWRRARIPARCSSSRNLHTPRDRSCRSPPRKLTWIQSVYSSTCRVVLDAVDFQNSRGPASSIVTVNGSFSGPSVGLGRIRRADQVARGSLLPSRTTTCTSPPVFSPSSRRLRRVVRKHSLRAAQVGHAHRRELHAAQLLRRKRDRHADDAIEDAVVAQDAPKRLALSQQPHVGLAERKSLRSPAESIARGGRISTELSFG